MKREILLAGVGWISAGIICIAGWFVEKAIQNATGLLVTGLLVILIGALLLLLNKRLETTMERIRANQARRSRNQG